ncbi:IS66 family transposase [Prevotella sp. ne3005]|uniref:IS66 family transposase n=1 Tax=Prevotella sp. ne3005 TaxID=1761887 RepID=UPI000B885CE5|nr:IS66 family transposase [Prevotella sp. ne3005]
MTQEEMLSQMEMMLQPLQQVNASQAETIKELTEQNESLQSRIKELTAQIAWLNRQLFGRKSEKLPIIDPDYPDLFAGMLPENAQQIADAHDEAVEKIVKTKEERRQEKKNRIMMEDLPVLEQVILTPDNLDTNLYKKIGQEVTRIVEHKPGQLYIKEIIREKWGLKDNTSTAPKGMSGVLIAPMPLLPIYKGIAGASLLAEILLQKYEYHMPYYRQIKQYSHLGMKGLTESTVDGWFKQTMELLKPLYEVLKSEVMKADYVQADETTTPVINKETHKAAKEYLWMVWAVMERLVLFHYDQGSRAGAVIESLANRYNFKGYLQCDGFAGYETAFKTNPDVLLVNCMVHIRRHLEQALDENRPMAELGLKEIQHLYKIEHMCDDAGMSFDERKAKRQELSKPIMEAMKLWMETEGVKYSESSLIGKAITYAYTRWDNMMRYLDDGRLLLDNNLAENEIRPVTLGRKNYLFCGNHEAAQNMAVVCSLLATCRNHDVNPRDYLNNVISQMPYHTKASYEELLQLLPHKWKLTHPESVMTKTT